MTHDIDKCLALAADLADQLTQALDDELTLRFLLLAMARQSGTDEATARNELVELRNALKAWKSP